MGLRTIRRRLHSLKVMWAEFKTYHFAADWSKENFLLWKYARGSITPRQMKRLQARGLRSLQLKGFKEAAVQRIQLSEEVPSTTTPPRGLGYGYQDIHNTCPPIEAYCFENAVVDAQSNHLLLDGDDGKLDTVAVPDVNIAFADRYLWHGRCLVMQQEKMYWSRVSPTVTYERGIALFGDGSANWFHWIIEFLPAAMLAEKLPAEFADYPLLVPIECKTIDSFKDALQIFADEREIIYLEHEQICSVKHLVRIDPIAFGPFDLQPDIWVEPTDYYQNEDLLRTYADRLCAALLPSPPEQTRRIFLQRGGGRRSYNEDECCEIARRYGLEPVRPEKLTLSEQAALFRSAKLIVGASGAAWTNMIFSGEGGAALSWLPANSAGFSSYSTLAGCLNRDMFFLEAHLDADAGSTGEVYTMGYRVDPQAFEAALKRIVGTGDQLELAGISAGRNISDNPSALHGARRGT